MCICKRRVVFFEKYLRSNIRRFVRRKVHHISKTHFQGIEVVAGWIQQTKPSKRPVLSILSQCLQQNGHPKGVRTVQKFSSFEEITFARRFRSKKIPPAVGLVGKLTRSRVDSPPWGVGDRQPPSNDDRADVVVTSADGGSINNLGSGCSRIGLKSTEILMHVLPVGKSILQGESNRLCNHKARDCVDNGSVEDMVSPMYIPSTGSRSSSAKRS